MGVIDEELPYYDEEKFLALPKDMTDEEKHLLSQFLEFIEFRRKNISSNKF